MNDLKVFFVVFAIHKEKEWAAHAGYVFANDEGNLQRLLNDAYGEVFLRYVEPIDVKEGTILYGKQWNKL